MKKLLAVWVLLLAAVSANAADKKCPGTVHFLDGRTLECTSITIPGWIDAEVSVRVLSDGKNQARTLAAVEIAYHELYCVPFIKEKGKKKIPAARWLVPESSGRHVAFFTRYQTYKMSNKGLVGIVNPKLNVTEPSAYFWKSDEKSPVFLGQYLFFQNSNKKLIALVVRYFEDVPAMLVQIRQRRWLGKGGGVAALVAFVAEHYVPQQEQE